MNILVVGALGDVGSAVAKKLPRGDTGLKPSMYQRQT